MGRRMWKLLMLVFFILVVLLNIFVIGISPEEKMFNDFIIKYGKTYKNGSIEYQKRFGIFKESLARHKWLNSYRTGPHDAFYGVTQFADLTQEEFASSLLGGRARRPAFVLSRPKSDHQGKVTETAQPNKDIPKKYTLQGRHPPVLTSVKNQGTCGGCWAFSIVECLETQHALKTRTLYDLSAQQVLDCNNVGSDHGCSGGNLCETLKWLNSTKEKVVLAKDYPYKQKSESCDIVAISHGLVYLKNYTCHQYAGEEQEMVSLIYRHGPLLAAIDATSFQDYMGGIIQHHCTAHYDNHAVQIVGYDQTGPIPFYIVRNSWGATWGLGGYLHIKIGGNLCGIANAVGSVNTN
ncbi:cathepsin O-like [Acanthaster planci]|uniref:Cathepsin O-like n=1 Tax=Acanthaster planci TaxID=133434 RepID=A0A8B7Y2E0_ACAPL|nr:cathepsin O-like [Acanthaster planci]